MKNIPINERDRIHWKQQLRTLLPADLESVAGQKTILAMIQAVLPAAEVCAKNAETNLWPKVSGKTMPMREARRQCGTYLNKLAGITIVDNLKLEGKSTDVLRKAWVALDTYQQVMSPQELAKLRLLQDQLLMVLILRENPKAAAAAPVQESRTMEVVYRPAPKPAAAPAPAPRPAPPPEKKERRESGTPKLVLLAILAAALIFGLSFGWKYIQVDKAIKAIEAIGHVTIESSGAIKNAENACEVLSEEALAEVTNYPVLTAARTEYDRLEKLILDAVEAIEAIGEVTLDSEEAIETAQKAYEALQPDQLTIYIPDQEKILEKAKKDFEEVLAADLHQRGTAFLKKNNFDAALPLFQQIVEDCPGSTYLESAREQAAACLVALAEKRLNSGKLEEAKKLLDQAREDYTDSKENKALVKRLEQRLSTIRPVNGRKFHNSVDWGQGTLNVTAGEQDVCIRLVSTKNPENYLLAYVRSEETASFKVKNGEYEVYFTSDAYWFDQEVGFGSDAVYKKVDKVYNFTTWKDGSTTYYYSFDLIFKDSTGGDFSATTIPSSQFWGS